MAIQKLSEDMLIAAIQNNFTSDAIEVMRVSAGISEARLEKLKNMVQKNTPAK